jgi:hypothetical protein
MSPQVIYALRKAGVLVGIAVLGVAAEQTTGVLTTAGVDPVWYPMIMGVIAAGLRTLEGVRDADRAARHEVIPADVAYNVVPGPVRDDGVKHPVPVLDTTKRAVEDDFRHINLP